MAYVQANRRVAITTPLGKDALLLRAFRGSEAISQLFHFDLDLSSENDTLKFEDVVGKNVTLRLFDADGEERHWNGFISRFSQGSQDRRLTTYHAQMVPWLWFLTRTADCKIFQNQKVPDIIQNVFKDLGFHDFEIRLYGAFAARDYCVQYRETDFAFVSRLMEEEGIFYYFRHEATRHVLVLSNDPAGHYPCPKPSEVRYDARGGGVAYEEVITDWRYEMEFRTGSWTQTDYNFETPSTNLAVTVKGNNPYEVYDYPGEHLVRSEGDRLARIRLQEQSASCAVNEGSGGCTHFSAGFKFTLKDHYRADLNQPYLLRSVQHMGTQGGDYGGAGSGEFTYTNHFQCIPFSVPYRPPRVTRPPFVQGCQTAVVVGPAGEEIYTDKHGRVKVQFHWDRDGKKNENSSCWIRVSHPWAGKGWGAVSIPRIGQEVVVDFLEGNPDMPIIIGRVYNAEQSVPFGMPGGAVVSGIKSNSTKGGGGYNEISLNDTKGTELINIHAQYDQQKKIEHDERVNVGNDRTESVGHDEKITVGNNRTEKVGVNEDITIGSNRTEHVGSNETIHIGANRTETVGANESIAVTTNRTRTVGGNETVTVSAMRTHTVGINEAITVGAAQEITVGAFQALTVGAARTKTIGASETVSIGAVQNVTIAAAQSISVGASQSTKIGAGQTVSVGADLSETIGSNHSENVSSNRTASVGGDDSLQVAKKLTISAGDQITITTGDASISMKKDGTITISGKNITLKASGKITGEADGNVILKGQKILQN